MKRFAKRLCALLAAMVLAVLLPCAALAAVPTRPDDYGTVLDEAGVLSAAFEEKLQQKNENLFEKTGSEIAVVCVDFLDGEDIEDYAYDLFNAWGIGSSERNNGLLLLLAIAEDNYYALPGYGIEDTFTGSYLQEMLDENLEDDFAAGNYESGVEKFFNAAYTELATYTYSDNITGALEAEPIDGSDIPYVEKTSVGSTAATLVGFVVRLVVLIVVIVLVVAVVRAAARLNRTPPPPPAGGVVPPPPQRSRFWEGMFVGSMLNHHRRPPRRNPWGAPPPPHHPPHHQPGPRPGGFGSSGRPGGFGGPSRPSKPSGGGFSHGGGSRPSGSRPSGGFSRGGGSRGGGAGRK